MKEIIFIRQSASQSGGIEWQILNLAEKLFSRGCFKPVLITSDSSSAFAKDFAARGFEAFFVPMGKSKIFSAAKEILKLLEGRKVAVIQTHLICESFIGRLVRKERADVRHIFRAETYVNTCLYSFWKKNASRLLDKISSRWVDCYIVNGQYLAKELVNHLKINPKKVIALLNGRDSIGTADKPCNQPDKPLQAKIAMIANFVRGKGHDCLIKSLAILKKRNLIIQVRLIGGELTTKISDSEKQNNISLIRKTADQFGVSGQIEFYGYTKDIYNALEGISIVVLPSDSEGVPNCILEAMSLRKLVIASDTGGVSEIIDNKKTGFLHKPKDPEGFADILEYVLTHKAGDFEQIRTAGFEKWQEKFTGEKMINDFIEIYKKLSVL